MSYRYHEGRESGPTLEWKGLPVVGAGRARHRFRARVWRAIIGALLLFWGGGVVWLIVGALT